MKLGWKWTELPSKIKNFVAVSEGKTGLDYDSESWLPEQGEIQDH